jgi:hypothetical protein
MEVCTEECVAVDDEMFGKIKVITNLQLTARAKTHSYAFFAQTSPLCWS